jgi:hypothetical protein
VDTFYITYWDLEFSSVPLPQLNNEVPMLVLTLVRYKQEFESEGQRACFVCSLQYCDAPASWTWYCMNRHTICEASRPFEFPKSWTLPLLVWIQGNLHSSKCCNFLTVEWDFSRKWINYTHDEEGDVYVGLLLVVFYFRNFQIKYGRFVVAYLKTMGLHLCSELCLSFL